MIRHFSRTLRANRITSSLGRPLVRRNDTLTHTILLRHKVGDFLPCVKGRKPAATGLSTSITATIGNCMETALVPVSQGGARMLEHENKIQKDLG